ncbi:MAG: hypothetical protein QOJ67_1275 [Acidimicrobiaceae bacterium]
MRGSSHIAAGLPNQDAWAATEPGPSAVTAVADGHGSRRCCRSGWGARFAADLAVEIIGPLSASAPTAAELDRTLRHVAGPQLVERWRAAVVDDARARPFSAEELAAIGTTAPTAEQTLLAYGTTLSVVCGSPSAMGALAIGDGDVVMVAADGTSVSRPLPDDPDNVGNVTSSLSQREPLDSLRVATVDLQAHPMLLGWASTDGYGGAFVADAWWRDVGVDLAERAVRLPPEQIEARIPEWLAEPAEVAGDDATMAILLRTAAAPTPPVPPAPPVPPIDEQARAGARTAVLTPPVAGDTTPTSRSRPRSNTTYALIAVLAIGLIALGYLIGKRLTETGASTFTLAGNGAAVEIDPSAPSAKHVTAEVAALVGLEATDPSGVTWTMDGTTLVRTAPDGSSKKITLPTEVVALVVNDNRLWLLSKDAKQVLFLPINTDCTGDLCLPGILKVTG